MGPYPWMLWSPCSLSSGGWTTLIDPQTPVEHLKDICGSIQNTQHGVLNLLNRRLNMIELLTAKDAPCQVLFC